MSEILYFLVGGTSLLGFTADLVAIIVFINSVKEETVKRDSQPDIARKILTILVVFSVSLVLYLLVRDPAAFNLDNIIYMFSGVYILLAGLTVVLGATVLKGRREPVGRYLILGFTALISYILGMFLLFLLGRQLQVLCLVFFFIAILEVVYLVGEYVLKIYLELQGVAVDARSVFGEYPRSLSMIGRGMRDLFSRGSSDSVSEASGSGEDSSGIVRGMSGGRSQVLGAVEYRNWLLDVGFLVFTMTLGVFLLLFNTDYSAPAGSRRVAVSDVPGSVRISEDFVDQAAGEHQVGPLSIPEASTEQWIGGPTVVLDTTGSNVKDVDPVQLAGIFENVSSPSNLVTQVVGGVVAIERLTLVSLEDAGGKQEESSYGVDVNITNRTDRRVVVQLDKGQVFENTQPNSGYQNLILARDSFVTLGPHERLGKRIPAFCLNSWLAPPRGQEAYVTPLKVAFEFRSQGDVWAKVARRLGGGA